MSVILQVQVRRDTAANWNSNNPTLTEAEFGYETDTTFMKVGDGTTAWASLPYFGKISGSITDNQIAFGAAASDDIEGDPNFTWDGTIFSLLASGLHIKLGAATTSFPKITRVGTIGGLTITGGSDFDDGGQIVMYGSTHPTQAGDVRWGSNNNIVGHWVENQGHWLQYTGTGVGKTLTTTVNSAGFTLESGGIRLLERAAGAQPVFAGYGEIWLKNTAPNTLFFTDDNGVDHDLTVDTFPGGADTQIQYNNGGAFGGDPNLTWDGTTLGVTGDVTMAALTSTGISDNATSTALTIDSSQNATFAGQVNTVAGTTTLASLNIPTGVAKTTPAQGDIWVTATDIFARINGVSESLLGGGGSSYNITDNSDANWLTVDINENATFTGDVNISKGDVDTTLTLGDVTTNARGILNITGGLTTSPYIAMWQGGNQRAYIQYLDAGGIFRFDSDNDIQLRTNNTPALTIDTFQNSTFAGTIGVGIAPVANMPLKWSVPTGAGSLNMSGQDMYLYCTSGAAYLGNQASANTVLVTNNTAAITISPTQNSTFAGDIILSSGKGITFPSAFTNTGDVNTLDDYEEGTFTPELWDDTLATDPTPPTYGNQIGTYTKIGNIVRITVDMSVTALGSLNTAQTAHIGGLPFSAHNHGPIYVGFASGLSITASESVAGLVAASTSHIDLYLWNAAGGVNLLTSAKFSATGRVILSATYKILQ